MAALGLALLLAGTACGAEHPQSTIHPASDFAEIIHSLYVTVFWWTMLILAVVWGLLAYVLYRFRERPDGPEPKGTRGHLGLEIAWTVGPAIIVVAIAIPSIQGVFATQRPVAEDALQVEVTGHRFWWEFHYPEQGVTTANELHLPVDRPVSLRLGSADVIHSFWVPLLGGKRDVNPVVAVRDGEPDYTWLHFTPTQTGVFMGQCAEFCGQGHALMGIRVIVEGPGDFEAWVERWHTPSPTAFPSPTALPPEPDTLPEGEPPPEEEPPQVVRDEVAEGRDLFFNRTFCLACHAIEGTPADGREGPDLTRFGSRLTVGAGILENNRENLVRWIRFPHELKPGVQMPGVDRAGGGWPATNLTEEQVEAIAAYLLSLE